MPRTGGASADRGCVQYFVEARGTVHTQDTQHNFSKYNTIIAVSLRSVVGLVGGGEEL